MDSKRLKQSLKYRYPLGWIHPTNIDMQFYLNVLKVRENFRCEITASQYVSRHFCSRRLLEDYLENSILIKKKNNEF